MADSLFAGRVDSVQRASHLITFCSFPQESVKRTFGWRSILVHSYSRQEKS